jgi:uncharacterized membrane protein YbhN (UPF0104 family)
MRTRIRKALRACGLILSMLALAWIGLRFVRGGGFALLRELPIGPWQLGAVLVCGALAYALANGLLSFAWWRMLVALSPQPPPPLATMASYAVSQYGRYLPGNVAHYALRHAWSRRFGIPHESLGLAAILEAVLLVLVACGLTLLADARGQGLFSFIDPHAAIALLLAGLTALWFTLRWAQRRGGIGRLHIPALSAPMLLTSLLCYAGFLVLCAVLLAGLAHGIGIDSGSFLRLLAANAASWFAGFVVIGAPAGLGVREATFVALSQADFDERHALLLIGLFRVVTLLGDTVFMAVGALSLRVQGRRSRERVA